MFLNVHSPSSKRKRMMKVGVLNPIRNIYGTGSRRNIALATPATICVASIDARRDDNLAAAG